LNDLLEYKFRRLAMKGVKDLDALYQQFTGLVRKTPQEIRELYDFPLVVG
jgi:hypothetical protein